MYAKTTVWDLLPPYLFLVGKALQSTPQRGFTDASLTPDDDFHVVLGARPVKLAPERANGREGVNLEALLAIKNDSRFADAGHPIKRYLHRVRVLADSY